MRALGQRLVPALAAVLLLTACSGDGGVDGGGREGVVDERALPIADFASGWRADDARSAAAATDDPRAASDISPTRWPVWR